MLKRMVLVALVAEEEFNCRHRPAQGDDGLHFRFVDPLARRPMARFGHHPQRLAVPLGDHFLRRFAAVAAALHRIPAPRLACPLGPVHAPVVRLLDETPLVEVVQQILRALAGRTEMENRPARRTVDAETDHTIVDKLSVGHGSGLERNSGKYGDKQLKWFHDHDCGGGTGLPSRRASSQTFERLR